MSAPINLHKKVIVFCWTRRICSGTSSSTRRAWRRCWRSATSCSTMPTPAAATRRTTPSSRRPAAWTAAGGTSVPCPWRGGWGERSGTSTGFTNRALTVKSLFLRFSLISCVVVRIEETWRLWCKFLDDFSRFEDWLKTSELTAANPDSADVLYTSAKEELKKFEVRK